MVNLKKAFASKMASSSSGRSYLKKIIGEDGVKFTDFFESFSDEIDKELTKKLKKDVFKIIAKVGVLHEQKSLTEEDITKVIPSLINLAKNYRNQIKLSMLALDYSEYPKIWKEINNRFTELLKDHSSDKTLKRLEFIEAVLGEEENNRKFFTSTSPEALKAMDEISPVLENILAEFKRLAKGVN